MGLCPQWPFILGLFWIRILIPRNFCNSLHFLCATTYIFQLQLPAFLFCNKQLNSVIDSDTFISSIERIRKNSQYTKDSKCGLDFAKSLMDLMYAMAENAQQILDHLDFVSQQERALYPYECTVKPFSDKDRTIIECAAFSQRDWLMFFYRLELPKTQLLINASNKEEILTYEKLSKDIKAQEVLGGIADIFATLNLAWNITEHMHDILSEITKDKLDSILYLPLEAYVYAIMDKRKRIYRYIDYSGVLRAIIPDLRSQCSEASRPV